MVLDHEYNNALMMAILQFKSLQCAYNTTGGIGPSTGDPTRGISITGLCPKIMSLRTARFSTGADGSGGTLATSIN